MDDHLDLLGLDAVRAGDATPAERAHADQCAQCRATLARFQDLAGRLAPRKVEVPPQLTRTILALARPRRSWLPMAAAALVLIGLAGFWLSRRTGPAIPGDVDGNGRVDIVDAYTLAVRIQSGQPLDPRWDVTGDGRVDAQDVEEIARRSVAIR